MPAPFKGERKGWQFANCVLEYALDGSVNQENQRWKYRELNWNGLCYCLRFHIRFAALRRRLIFTADYIMAHQAQSTNTIQVTVLIAGRPYLLNINKSDEALIHRLAKAINDKIAAFEASQPSRDLQDCFALALLTYAVESHRANQVPG